MTILHDSSHLSDMYLAIVTDRHHLLTAEMTRSRNSLKLERFEHLRGAQQTEVVNHYM
jgi:hypothetical protein